MISVKPTAGHRRLAQRQEANPAEQPRLEHRTAQHRAGRHGRGRMRQRQPEMEAQGARLDPKSHQQQQQCGLAEHASMQFRDLCRASADGEEHEAGEDQHFAEHRQGQVDSSGARGLGVTAMKHQSGRRQSHEREADVESGNVGGQDQAEVARHGQQEEEVEADRVRIFGKIGAGIPA